MTSFEVAEVGTSRVWRVGTLTAYAAAAAFLVAAAWYGLVVAEVVVALKPSAQPGQPQEEWLQSYFAWFGSTLDDKRFYGGAAIAGFLCLAVVAAFARERLGHARSLATLGAHAVRAGAVIWVVGAFEEARCTT
jgi:hypothetical protein